MNKISIVLADDHMVVREGTRRILEDEPDLKVVGEASDGAEAVRLVMELKPDVAVIDVSMPKLNGIEASRHIKRETPETAVLILSAYDDDEYVSAFLEAGASGYLLKNVSGSILVDAVRTVYAGESVLHPKVTRKVLDHYAALNARRPEDGAKDHLTQREKEVLRLAGKGLSNRDIGNRLFLSPRTVQSHLNRTFHKLQVSCRTEAVTEGLRKGILKLEDISRGDDG